MREAFTVWWHRTVCAPDPYPNELTGLDRLEGMTND